MLEEKHRNKNEFYNRRNRPRESTCESVMSTKQITLTIFLVLSIPLIVLAGQAQQFSQDKLHAIFYESWQAYKSHFIKSDGRVIDKDANDVSTSEGQSYALLRAVGVMIQTSSTLF